MPDQIIITISINTVKCFMPFNAKDIFRKVVLKPKINPAKDQFIPSYAKDTSRPSCKTNSLAWRCRLVFHLGIFAYYLEILVIAFSVIVYRSTLFILGNLKGNVITRVMWSNKMESRRPKGIVGINRERRWRLLTTLATLQPKIALPVGGSLYASCITGFISTYIFTKTLKNKVTVRQNSTLSQIFKTLNREYFIEWFRGFVELRMCFIIAPNNKINFNFIFQIGLHIDDLPTLLFIQKNLGIGTVSTSGNTAVFKVGSQKEISIIIGIFNNSPLNSTKHLNFLDFKTAFYLYKNTKKKTLELKKEIDSIRSGVNSKRSNFKMPESSKHIRITSYWLLGFVEGEVHFMLLKARIIDYVLV